MRKNNSWNKAQPLSYCCQESSIDNTSGWLPEVKNKLKETCFDDDDEPITYRHEDLIGRDKSTNLCFYRTHAEPKSETVVYTSVAPWKTKISNKPPYGLFAERRNTWAYDLWGLTPEESRERSIRFNIKGDRVECYFIWVFPAL